MLPSLRIPRSGLLAAMFCALAAGKALAVDPAPSDKALLIVRLPESASLTIGNSATSQGGRERVFESPSLKPPTSGMGYYYTLTATWTEGGKKRTTVRDVLVSAGAKAVVNLWEPTQPLATSKIESESILSKILPPPGNVELFKLRAIGVQEYKAKSIDEKGGFEWVLVGPRAGLYSDQGEPIGSHYEGPTWKADDGSKVTGELVAKTDSADPKAIPWLLLKAKPNDVKGLLSDVSYVQRVDTQGGRASLKPPQSADAVLRVNYKATYVFFGPEKAKAPKTQEVKARTFQFTYSATVTGLPADKTARIWLPVPQTTDDQTVEIVAKDLPAEGKIDQESRFGNKVLYVEAKAGPDGTIPLKVTYRITRREVVGKKNKPIDDNDRLAMFLRPDAMVPIDGKPLDLIKGKELPMDQTAAAHVLYDIVKGHMRYSKEGTGWGEGDSVWACDSKYGNCTDFHSLFISLARSQKIPCKFEIGFSIPEKRGAGDIPAYHCWGYFKPKGEGWIPVDISEAWKNPKMQEYYFGNLTEDRVTFSTGRDIDLVPKQAGKSLNYFIYPYVEVDGKPHAADKIQKRFGYEDVK